MQPKISRLATVTQTRDKRVQTQFIPGKPSWSALTQPERYAKADTHGGNGDDARAFHARMAHYKRMMQGE